MNKNKILFVFDTSGYGGAGESLFTLVKNLKDTYRIIVALPGPGHLTDKLTNIGIQVDYIQNESWRWWVRTPKQVFNYFLTLPLQLLSLINWFNYINKLSPDIVHININRLIEPVIVLRLLKIPCVIHFRDIPSKMKYYFAIGWTFYYKIVNLADQFIANSNTVKDDISPFGKVPLQVIHNGLDITDFDLRSTQKCEIELPKDNIKIAMLGGINPWKKQKEFIEIAIKLLKKRNDILFYVVGEVVVDSYHQELRKSVNDSGYSMNIFFTGHVKNPAAMLKEIDIMLHTMPHESFGRVFIEAMAAKKPVVAFDSGGASEIVVNDETGILVPSGDISAMEQTMLSLIDDPEKRKKMGEAGRKRVEENYSIHKHCEYVLNVYHALLNGVLLTKN